MKKTIKIDIVDYHFYYGQTFYNSLFYRLLSKKYDVVRSKNPDFLIHSVYPPGNKPFQFTQYDCTRILYSPECVAPHFEIDDYALTFDYIESERHFRLPFFRYLNNYQYLFREKKDPELALREKKKFCNFVQGNVFMPQTYMRTEFFKKLSRYKKVDSLGSFLNNAGYSINLYDIHDIDRHISQYKFSISFENTSCRGYTTEKIMNALLGGTIPIYWGDPQVGFDFNPKCFINCGSFDTFEEVIEHVREVDANDRLWMDYYAQPVFENGHEPDHLKEAAIECFLSRIIENPFPLGKPAYQFHGLKPYWQKIYSAFYYYNRSKIVLAERKINKNLLKTLLLYLDLAAHFFVVCAVPSKLSKMLIGPQIFFEKVLFKIISWL